MEGEISVWDKMDYMDYMEMRTMPIVNEISTNLAAEMSTLNEGYEESNDDIEPTKNNEPKEYYVLSDYMN